MADLKISALTASTTPLAGTEVLPIVQSSTTKQVSVANLTAGRAVTALNLALGGALPAGTTFYSNAVSGDMKGRYDASTGTTACYHVFVNTTVSTVGTENSAGGSLVASSSPYATVLANSGAYPVQIGTNNTVTWTFDTSGNFVPKTAAKGINFTANTPAAGMTSQLLNWYEQGTFTPVAQGSSTAGTASYSVQTGQYTRIGNRVLFNLRIVYTGGTGTGNMRVGGLPFTSNSAMAGAVVSVYAENLAGTALYIFAGLVAPNATYIGIDQVPVGGGGAIGLTYDGAADIALSGHYFV